MAKQTDDRPVIRAGFLAFDGETTFIKGNDAMLAMMAAYLKEALPQYRFDIRFLGNEALHEAFAGQQLELFFSSSGFYREVSGLGAFALGTLASAEAPDPNKAVAGIFIVRADSGIRHLGDAEGKIVAGSGPRKFMNWLVAMGELAQRGWDPEHFFAAEHFVGSNLSEIPRLVAEGRVDVGVMRACTLEPMLEAHPEWQRQLRVLEPQPVDGLRCLRSSAMYPGWTMGAAPGIDPAVAKNVADALLQMNPKDHNGYFWSIATRWDQVDGLFRALKIGPYEHLRILSFQGFLEKAKPFLLAAAVLFLAWVAHWLRTEGLIRQRTAQLVLAQKKATEAERRMNALMRLGVVSQFSTIFAHEIRQPLSALRYLLDALKLLAASSSATASDRMSGILKRMDASLLKADAIVSRVRGYAKSKRERLPVDVVGLLKEICDDAALTTDISPNLLIDRTNQEVTAIMVAGDPLELRIAFANLIQNACQAVKLAAASTGGQASVRVILRTDANAHEVHITIENGGLHLDPTFEAQVGRPFASSKPEGLGLGILVAVTILEAHLGSVRFARRAAGGLLAEVVLPLRKEDLNG